MKKMILISSILVLILITSFVKNSTKKIEDKMFIINQNIRSLEDEFENVLLEYNYLSSPDKLLKYQSKYFDNDLIQMDITKFKRINESENQLIINDFIEKVENKVENNE